MKKTSLTRAAAAALVCLTPMLGACRDPQPPAGTNVPVIFVHGFMGSGAQYRSQALRWASNGFPMERVKVFNYNTGGSTPGAPAASGLNAFVDAVRAEFGVSKVHLVGHSLGTFQVSSYVSSNAAKVEKYALVDGIPCLGGDTCLTISAASMGQTHVEAAVSAESFERQYRHFTGRAPTTTDVVPATGAQVTIAGNMANLQTNLPAEGLNAQVWEINSATGARATASPKATYTVRANGSFGPVTVDKGKHYEIAATLSGITAHYYFEPFMRNDNLLHMVTLSPTSATVANTNRGPNHVALVLQRQSEMWRSHGAQNDVLRITQNGQTANVFQNVTSDVVGVHMHDDTATPGSSSLALLDYFRSQAFQTGVDVFMPAANPPTGTITVANTYRGDASKVQRLNVLNWPSSAHHVSVELNDYVN